MKKILFSFLLISAYFCSAQSKKDIINPNTPMVWFGCDYSNAMFTKKEEYTNLDQILRFFVDNNNIVKDVVSYEQPSGALKREVVKDFSFVTVKNAQVDWHQVYSDDLAYKLSDETIQQMIGELKIDKQKYKDNIGLVFCEENISKTNKSATIAVVFFRVNDLTPLLIKHVSYKPKGYGFMNYWSYPNRQAMYYLRDIKKELK
ncbi:MAG: hypothetical protein NTY96_02015 [Bacteroidetes bacterium]|nr:hypothetical protein [Bacteroidota bacterium]